ncbi:MAG: peroxiredoxin [Actinobacteria bacterium]|nr:peroxiredoxin [Actinomycetota bacterium]
MKPGDTAPTFSLPANDGSTIRLEDELAQGPVVLFFYPKAMTPGCTKESCHFRDLASEFADVKARRIGISADSVDKQQQFSEKHGFDYPLVSDTDRTVAKAYGVKRPGPIFNKRMTFVIGQDGKLLDVIASETNMDSHADKALATLRAAAS